MAFQGNRYGAAKTWFCLNSDQALDAITAQNKGPKPIEISLNGSATVPPTTRDGSLIYMPGDALGGDESFTDRFSSASSPGYVWCISEEPATVSVTY